MVTNGLASNNPMTRAITGASACPGQAPLPRLMAHRVLATSALSGQAEEGVQGQHAGSPEMGLAPSADACLPARPHVGSVLTDAEEDGKNRTFA